MVQLFFPPDCHKSTPNHHSLKTLPSKVPGGRAIRFFEKLPPSAHDTCQNLSRTRERTGITSMLFSPNHLLNVERQIPQFYRGIV